MWVSTASMAALNVRADTLFQFSQRLGGNRCGSWFGKQRLMHLSGAVLLGPLHNDAVAILRPNQHRAWHQVQEAAHCSVHRHLALGRQFRLDLLHAPTFRVA